MYKAYKYKNLYIIYYNTTNSSLQEQTTTFFILLQKTTRIKKHYPAYNATVKKFKRGNAYEPGQKYLIQ